MRLNARSVASASTHPSPNRTQTTRKKNLMEGIEEVEMIIPEDPHKGLLDDEGATAIASEQLKPWTNLLRDLANYGSNLIPRAYSSSGKELGDAVVIGILFRQVVAMIDAIEILLCRSAVHAASLQLRAMFEASVYLEWMLAVDRGKKRPTTTFTICYDFDFGQCAYNPVPLNQRVSRA